MSSHRLWLVFLALGLIGCRFESAGVGPGDGEPAIDGDGFDPPDSGARIDADPLAPDAGPVDASVDAGPVDAAPADADPSATLVIAESDLDLVGLRRAPAAAGWTPLGTLQAGDAPRWAAAGRSRLGGFLAVATLGGGEGRRIELHGEDGEPPVLISGLSAALARVRAFDLAIEPASGQALVVYANGTSRPRYATFAAGVWSSPRPLPINDGIGPTLNTAPVEWVQLVAAPTGDRVALLYSDAAGRLQAIFWEGDGWRTSGGGTSIVTANLKRNPVDFAVQNRVFDGAFEQLSGDLVVAFGREGQAGFAWSQWDASSDFWTAAVGDTRAPASGEPQFVDLAAEPGTDRVAGVFADLGDGSEPLGAAIWSGGAWIAASELDPQARGWNDKGQGRFPAAVAWLGGSAVLAYADESGQLSWARWQEAGEWALAPDFALAGVGLPESLLLVAHGEELLGVLVDDNQKLFSAAYDGVSWRRLQPAQLSDKLIGDALPVVLLGSEP